jgi:hypothetical protein
MTKQNNITKNNLFTRNRNKWKILFILVIAISSLFTFYYFSYFSYIVSLLKETFTTYLGLGWEVLWKEKGNELLLTIFEGFMDIVVTIIIIIFNLVVPTIYADNDSDSDFSGSDMDLGSDDYLDPKTVKNEGPASTAEDASHTSAPSAAPAAEAYLSHSAGEAAESFSSVPAASASPDNVVVQVQESNNSQGTSANVPFNETSSDEEMLSEMEIAAEKFETLEFHNFYARGPIEVRMSVDNQDTIHINRSDLKILRNDFMVNYHSHTDGKDYVVTSDIEGNIRCYKVAGVDANGDTKYLNEADLAEEIFTYDNSKDD